jgi:transposase-like protein
MKKNESPDLTLIQIIDRFPTDDAARAHLESIRWPKGPVCPHCKTSDQTKFSTIAANPEKKVRAGLRWCAACEKQFTVTIGTIFEDSHIPLRKWLIAWYLICSSKKGISSLQLQRLLELGSYRSALKDPVFQTSMTGTVEVDETYVGGKPETGWGVHNKRGRGTRKTPVVSLLERGGRVKSQVVRPVTGKNIKAILQKHVSPYATIMTDEYIVYPPAAKGFHDHQTVNHAAKEYVRGPWHTNGVEGFFSLLKRGVMGTFHHISERHLPLYLAEFDHRHNCREMTDGERTMNGLAKVEGKRLMLRAPVN